MKFRGSLSTSDRLLVVFYSTVLALMGVCGLGIPVLPIQAGGIFAIACSVIGLWRLFLSYRK